MTARPDAGDAKSLLLERRGSWSNDCNGTRVLTAMIFGANPELLSSVNHMCCDAQDISLFRSLDHYPRGREALQLLNSYAPQLVFVEMDCEGAWLELESDIRTFHPGTAIVRVSRGVTDSSLEPTAGEERSVLRLPCDRGTFRTTIYRALETKSEEKNAPIFVFLPAKAGSGATTTALFVTHILSNLAHKKTLLLECDLHAGPVSMLYNLRPEYSIMDALEDAHRLTDDSWKRLTTSVDGFDVLPSVSQQGVRHVSPWAYQRLLAFTRSRYDVVICDLPEVVNDATEVVVQAAKAILVVTTPSFPSLRLAARRRHELEKRGVSSTKLRYVLNRAVQGQTIPLAVSNEIESLRVADVPLDENLFDASEFQPSAVNAQTLAECVKVAEFCTGARIELFVQRRKFFSSGWFRSTPRTPQWSLGQLTHS